MKRVALCLLAVFALISQQTPAPAKPKISLIVDSNTAEPGTSNNFSFGTFQYPEINSGQVVFVAADQTVWIAALDGSSLQLLLDNTTPIPKMKGSTFHESNGGWVQIVDGTVVVAGIDNSDNFVGYYSVPAGGGRITKLFDLNDAGVASLGNPDFHVNAGKNQVGELVMGSIPSSCGAVGFRMPVLGGKRVEIPPLPTCPQLPPPWCCNIGQPDISGGEIANLSSNGIGEAALDTVKANGNAATVNMLAVSDLPGFCEQYFSIENPRIDRGTVVFRFNDNSPTDQSCPGDGAIGIAAINGVGTVILADTTTPVPGGSGTFNANCSFNQAMAARDGTVVFQGCGDDQQVGIYAVSEKGGRVEKILAPGDTIPAGIVNTVSIGTEPISQGVVVMLVGVFPTYMGLYAAQLTR